MRERKEQEKQENAESGHFQEPDAGLNDEALETLR